MGLAQGPQLDRQGGRCIASASACFPWAAEGHGQVVVADGGERVGLAQGLQPDRQGAAVHRLGVGVLPLGPKGRGQVVVALGGARGAPSPRISATGREGLLKSLRSLGVLALAKKLLAAGIRSTSLREPILDLARSVGQSLVGLQFPPGVTRLPVVLPSEADQQVEPLAGRRDRLGDPARFDLLADRLLEVLDPLLHLRVGVAGGRVPGFLAAGR